MEELEGASRGTVHGAIVDRTVGLGRALQSHGVNVSLSEIIDAAESTTAIDLGSRDELRIALRATLVKDPRHYPYFDVAFDSFFPATAVRAHDPDDRSALDDRLVAAVGDGGDLAAVAAMLIDEHAGLDGDLRAERHHVQRVFLAADIARLMSRVRIADPSVDVAAVRARVDALKRLVAEGVRARLGADGLPALDEGLEDIAFLDASRAELDQMRDAIRPIARRLAARLEQRRRHQTGRANLRRTMRRSLASGGVPIDVVHDRPRARRPELFVLCDISGSVAEFSVFTLTLMSALSAEIARTRSFVFVDAVDEVTELLESTRHGIEPWQLLRNTNVIGSDGHSDYAAVFEQFWREVGERDLRSTSTVIITGDARTNHRGTGDAWLAEIAARTRRVYWLNPEPKRDWDTHDSEATAFATHCHATFEVRTLRQLVDCVERLL